MNVLIVNNKEIQVESLWKKNKYDKSLDLNEKEFPYPKENKKPWHGLQQFLSKLIIVENIAKNDFQKYDYQKDCILCGEKSITNGLYVVDDVGWENGLKHYIAIHNTMISRQFMDFIYFFSPKNMKRMNVKLNTDTNKIENNIVYVKINRNQLLILDALMRHGGYVKKYTDFKNNNVFRYSEHAGLLDFSNTLVSKIIVASNTSRIDKGDEEIYLPRNLPDSMNYEYIFHTHPPTPKPGGRVNMGILYEFPSIGDILHFIDHFNDGKTCGSLVIASEGLYNIRKNELDNKKLEIDEELLFKEYDLNIKKIQQNAIQKYGKKFSTYKFYSTISQDIETYDKLNEIVNKFNIKIDVYPRIKDRRGNWVIDTIYLPLYRIEKTEVI